MAESMQGYAALQRRIAAISGPQLGKPIMRTLALAAKGEAQAIVTHKTSNLARSIHEADITDVSARLVASAKYARFVEENTRPHIIRPTKAAALAWATTAAGSRLSGSPTTAAQHGSMGLGSTGSRIRAMRGLGMGIRNLGGTGASSGPMTFARVVHHPGTTGQHFMKRGAEAAIEKAGLLDKIVAAWNDAA